MADPDDLAIRNLARNRYRKKCASCGGSGYVMKYVRPNVVALVECTLCNGTGRARVTLQDDPAASKENRQLFGVKTNRQIAQAERKRLKREAVTLGKRNG